MYYKSKPRMFVYIKWKKYTSLYYLDFISSILFSSIYFSNRFIIFLLFPNFHGKLNYEDSSNMLFLRENISNILNKRT